MNYKRLFLKNYPYFITVVTHQRNPILIENIDLLRESFKYAKTKFDFDIEAIVILPDHFHLIIELDNPKEYSKIIGVIKSYFSKNCDTKYYEHLQQSYSREKQNYKPIWQKRFYEHTIRDERDLKLRLDYIHFNPVKHSLVSSVSDWEYSSFHKFVKLGEYDKEWGDFDSEIDFE